MPSSKTTKKSSENAPGPKARAPKTREAQIAQRANAYARPDASVPGSSFGAPVSASQVEMYEKALKSLRKSKPAAQFLGFKSTAIATRELGKVARGNLRSTSLPKPTREAFDQLHTKLEALHVAEGKTNKTWPRKHAIVLHALLTEKPARKPAPRTPKSEPVVTTPASSEPVAA